MSPDLVTGVPRSQQFCGQQPPRWPGSSEGSVLGCRTRGRGTAGLCLRPLRAAPQAGPTTGLIQPPDPRVVSCQHGRWALMQGAGRMETPEGIRRPVETACVCPSIPGTPQQPRNNHDDLYKPKLRSVFGTERSPPCPRAFVLSSQRQLRCVPPRLLLFLALRK